MAGTLAYEVHGNIEDAHDVYETIFDAGKRYGMRKLGQLAYMMNHTEDGFPQAYYHFPYPWYEDPGFAEYLDKNGGHPSMTNFACAGSMGPDRRLRYRNPIELSWAGMIKFDHEFTGRKALEKIVARPEASDGHAGVEQGGHSRHLRLTVSRRGAVPEYGPAKRSLL